MHLAKLRIRNFRSIRDTGEIVIEPLQALVGENNCGKSNILRAIQCFLSPGAGGMGIGDFNNPDNPAIIECEFEGLSDNERRHLRPYLLGDKVILRKELFISEDESRERTSIKTTYHGYKAEPRDAHLSIAKLEAAAEGGRVKWKDIGEQCGILEYVQDAAGKVNKTTYQAGISRYIAEHEVEYDPPELGQTQALGIPQNLLSALPNFFLLPAITDYSDEIDKRSSSTVFRKLMADLSDRVMGADPRYQELEDAIVKVRTLLNGNPDEAAPARLEALGAVEQSLQEIAKKIMPTVQSVSLGVDVDTSRDIFSKGVTIKINDGVLTDVLDKGHGMQRSLVFSLLQMLIKSGQTEAENRSTILAIEEPELYIHPHSQRLIFRVLRDFVGVEGDELKSDTNNQVIYTTHSPAFIEIWNYERIGVVRKPNVETGTIVRQAPIVLIKSAVERAPSA